jgi:hypothetical protein
MTRFNQVSGASTRGREGKTTARYVSDPYRARVGPTATTRVKPPRDREGGRTLDGVRPTW